MRNFQRILPQAAIIAVFLNGLAQLTLAQTASAPARSVFGIYGRLAAGRDSIEITPAGGGQIGVDLKLYFANGHTCQLKKDGEWSGDHIAIAAEGLETSRPCHLNLFFEDRRVRLEDQGLQCAPVYCGTRGKLDGVKLSKSTSKHK